MDAFEIAATYSTKPIRIGFRSTVALLQPLDGNLDIWKSGEVKTTLEIPDHLFRAAKAKAAMEGRRLTDLITEGLQLVLRKPPQALGKRLKFPLLKSRRKTPLEIPDDIAARSGILEDLERYESSLR